MILVAGGDSFTWGSELSDSINCCSQLTFPALLAKQANMEYQCVAHPGNSNQSITRITMMTCEEIKDQDIFVVVNWSFMSRFEFEFTYQINSPWSPWCSIQPQQSNKDEVKDFAKDFYRHVGTNMSYQTYHTMQSIHLLQSYLKSRSIPYMFTLIDNNFMNNSEWFGSSKVIRNLIDWDPWFFFPEGINESETTGPRGFYQWALENKYSVGSDGHPLEDAHRDAYNLIKDKFNELVKKID